MQWTLHQLLLEVTPKAALFCPGWNQSDRLKGTHRYLALYHLTDAAVSRSEAWSKAANTPWTEKMRPLFRDLLVLRCVKYTRRG